MHSYKLHYLRNVYVQLFSYLRSVSSHSSVIPFPISSFPPFHLSFLIPFPSPFLYSFLPSSSIIFSYLLTLYLLFPLFSHPPFLSISPQTFFSIPFLSSPINPTRIPTLPHATSTIYIRTITICLAIRKKNTVASYVEIKQLKHGHQQSI